MAALCDTRWMPAPRPLCLQSCADLLSCAAFPSQPLLGAMAGAHRLLEDHFSAELGVCRCWPVSPSELGPAGQ